MRALSLTPLLLLSTLACEPMPDPGSPFKAVQVQQQSSPEPAVAAEPAAVDPLFDEVEPLVIHSSELGQPAVDEPDAPSEAPSSAHEAAAAQADPVAESEPSDPAPPTVTSQALDLSAAPVGSSSGWPLRLVATVPGAQPPRAILGLPGGGEVVVTPGTMLPDAGVVVMAIGSGSVDLAEVRPAGDHAVVYGRSLRAQRSQQVSLAPSE